MAESRTAKSIKNAQVSFFYYVVFMILGFWSRKVFFDYLGSEVVGLESTVGNLLTFLNLAELGIGMAVTYFLYKPLFGKDYETINKIVALQGWIYKHVAYLVISGAVVLMFFFPRIFRDIGVPLWYAYVVFLVFLFGSMLGYFVNYRQIVLNTDQKGYKVARVTTGFGAFIKVVQIVLLPFVPHPFLFYVGTNVFCTLFSCWWLNHTIAKEYPWLNTKGYSGKQLLREYPEVLKKTKQLFIHKISTVILFNATPFIMYAFSTLTVVAYYSNYAMIFGKVKDTMNMIFGSTGAAIGNLIASGDKKKLIRVFWELYDSRFCMSAIILMSVFFLSHKFIVLWLGEKFVLSQFLLILLLIIQSLSVTRSTVDQYINGYGLFSDVWAPMTEGAINIGGALIFGYFFGYEGVIIGNILSLLLIIHIWKPIFLFKKGLEMSVLSYFKSIFFRYCILIVDMLLFDRLFQLFVPERFSSFLEFGIYGFIIFLIIGVVLFAEFYSFSRGTRDFVVRMVGVLHNRYK